MERKSLMAVEPRPNLGVLVRCIIVEDHMDGVAGGDFGLDGVQKTDELLMPVALQTSPNPLKTMVPRGGIEPPTRGFSVRCSTD